MKGGGTDNYYMQMVDGIRRYKGVREAPVASVAANLDINSDFSLWNRVEETFYDTPGDVTTETIQVMAVINIIIPQAAMIY